jgi:hypothetical protein
MKEDESLTQMMVDGTEQEREIHQRCMTSTRGKEKKKVYA